MYIYTNKKKIHDVQLNMLMNRTNYLANNLRWDSQDIAWQYQVPNCIWKKKKGSTYTHPCSRFPFMKVEAHAKSLSLCGRKLHDSSLTC